MSVALLEYKPSEIPEGLLAQVSDEITYLGKLYREVYSLDFSTPVLAALLNYKEPDAASDMHIATKSYNDSILSESIISDYCKDIDDSDVKVLIKTALESYSTGSYYNHNTSDDTIAMIDNISSSLKNIRLFCGVQVMSNVIGQIYKFRNGQIVSEVVEPHTRLLTNSGSFDDAAFKLEATLLDAIIDCASSIRNVDSDNILAAIANAQNIVANLSKRSRANVVIIHPDNYKLLDNSYNLPDNAYSSNVKISRLPQYSVYVTRAIELNKVIVGYVGSTSFDSGLIYAPYNMFNKFSNGQIATRSAIITADIPNYYVTLDLN